MLRAALFFWALAALPVAAQEVGARLEARFDTWLEEIGTTGGLGYAKLDGDVWATGGAKTPGELASVSKSVTAMCAWALVEEGALDWSDTVVERLGKGPDATVAQLVTHSSGLVRDSTQAAMLLWLDRPTGPAGHNAQVVLDLVAERGAPQGAPGVYAYNNENYALLALMIEAASGQAYAQACWPRLGLGAGMRIGDRSAAFGPWGGIVATPEAYLDFMTRHYGPGSAVWEDPLSLPHVKVGGGAYYSLGMLFRAFRGTYNFWHFGAQCFPGRLNAGSYAVMWEGKVSALALYDACVDWDTMVMLDGVLSRGVYGGGQ